MKDKTAGQSGGPAGPPKGGGSLGPPTPGGPLADALTPLVGARIPGGCPDCDAYQTVHPDNDHPAIWHMTIHHDNTCPDLARIEGRR